jgi:hypothetical protein
MPSGSRPGWGRNSSRGRNFGWRFCILPGYKWCGPGCSGPGAPINAVDAACKAHDECLEMCGQCCECDEEFLERLRCEMNPHTQEGRDARLLFKLMKLKMFFTR